ncbi:CBS domain-containing protein [Thiorhodococcus minor]|uniref:CBS domain-containing protein n=1 Tax=Thiorhodococcus minor TaxID=57489 RepID=A0A6M0K4T5_9GAMM|nr:CBS domain-containing protein [Thiorhodococcus minor]NEV64796.1 CBS domain-containing protein [Thiorhodococcus minor]
MRTQFTTLDPDSAIERAIEEMTRAGHWLLPVCVGSRLVGSLSLRDLVAAISRADGGQGARTVAEAMDRSPLRCGMETSLEDVRSLICSSRQPAICVTSTDDDLVGMIDAFAVIDSLTIPQAFSGPEPEEVRQVRGNL